MHMNSGLSRRARSGAALVASSWALLLGVACSDTHTQDGSDARLDAVHATQQAAAATDLTATDTLTNGMHAYTATLPPAAVVGTVTQTLEASWEPGVLGIKDAPVYPQYWSIDYYAGGTKLTKVPATLQEWAQVSRVVSKGDIQVEALDGDRQAIVSIIDAPPPKVSSSFTGESGGDGWDVFFDSEYTRVFNIHHHGSTRSGAPVLPTLQCKNLADSSQCAGYPITLTQSSHRSTGHIDPVSNKLWQPTVTLDAKLAWDCVDLTTSKRCATPVVVSQYVARPNSEGLYNDHVDPVVIGRKMYAVGFTTDSTSGDVTRITCLDMATGTECPGIVLPESGTFYQAGLEAMGHNLYVVPGENLHLDCYDSTTWTRCAGSWPQPVAKGPVWGVRGADSIVRNVCANNQCFSLDGSAHTLPPNFAARLAANPVVGRSYTYIQVGKASSVGTLAAWPITGDKSDCWNMATDTACSASFPLAVPLIYTSILDPLDSDCLWTNGDDGRIRNWKISTGTEGCSGGPLRISFRARLSIPRLGCDPASRVYLYKSFNLLTPSPSLYDSATVTVKDSEGAPIAGWINKPLPADGVLDLTGLTTAVAGVTPTFDVATTNLVNETVVPRAEFRVTTGSAPQLCWNLSKPEVVCPTTPGVAGHPEPVTQPTSVAAKGSFTLGSSTTHFTPQVMNTTGETNPPTFENCGTRLLATVTSQSDGKPVAGAVVYLLDNAGNPVLGANGQPVSAVSAADGTLEFPVWAASYRSKISGTSHYTPVYMNVTAGGSGTTFVSGNTVVSNTVTTTRGTTSHVAITVNTTEGGGGLCAPVVTSPPGGTVVYTDKTPLTGTAEPNSTVTVNANDQVVCTVVATPQGTWSCTAELPVGTSTVTAVSKDAAGNTSGTSSGVLITRRNGIDQPVITGPSGSVQGPGVTVTGTGHPGADITVKDERGNVVCTTEVDENGAWLCDGALSPGQHQLTVDADWQGLQSASTPHDLTVQSEAWFQGTSCAASGDTRPALMMVFIFGGLVLLRRRRA